MKEVQWTRDNKIFSPWYQIVATTLQPMLEHPLRIKLRSVINAQVVLGLQEYLVFTPNWRVSNQSHKWKTDEAFKIISFQGLLNGVAYKLSKTIRRCVASYDLQNFNLNKHRCLKKLGKILLDLQKVTRQFVVSNTCITK